MMKLLGDIDKRILKSLLKDGRRSFTDIADENSTTKDVVWKRFREMEKKGIITGATIQYNYQSFGYDGLANIFLNVESQKINQAIESIRKNQKVLASRLYGSTYNVWILAILRSLRDIEILKEAIRKQKQINEIKTCIWIDVRNNPENIILTDPEIHQAEENLFKKSIEIENSLSIDETDSKIVEKLAENGRASFRKIGQEIGISTDTVTRRYEKLVKHNFIKVGIQVNPKKLGYQSLLIINVLLSSQDETKPAAEAISRIPGISYVVKTSGDYDLNFAATVKDCNDIIAIIEKLENTPNVRRIEAILREIPDKWPGPRQYISTF
jgi:Lrp/AsnC family transcriptional regulator, regulator for asnA, asnC and gidA